MKNTFKTLAFIATVTIFTTSCSQDNLLDVTVISKADKNFAEQFMLSPNDGFCRAVTKSGDTINVLVDEKIYLDSTMPYHAKMRKNSDIQYGFVETENQK